MRHYRRNPSGNDRVKKIMFRILFVLIAAAVITFGTILLGNYLQHKLNLLDSAQLSEENESPAHDLLTPEEAGNTDYRSQDVFGACIILRDYQSEDEAVLAVNTLSQHYDTIMLDIMDADGNLLFTSPALCAANRMPAPEDNSAFRLFGAAAAAVKAQNRNLCVILTPNFSTSTYENAAWTDGTLITELHLYGVDEVLISFPDQLSLTPALSESIYDYITGCRSVSKQVCPIGVLLHAEHYLNDSDAPYIQQIANVASFLGIHFPSDEDEALGTAYRYVKNSITSLLGSFNVYNMRIILEGSPRILAAKYEGCKKGGVTNLCFSAYILPDDLTYNDQMGETEEETRAEPVDPADQTNPYATVKPEEEPEETAAAQDIPETVTPYASSDTASDEKPWY